MLRTCFTQSARSVTTPSLPAPSCARSSIHTSSILNAVSQRKRQTRLTKQANLNKRTELQQRAAAQRPHVVLGTRPGDESKWTSCDLARVLVSPEELAPTSTPSTIPLISGDVKVPSTLNYGLGEEEKRLLFVHLPLATADSSTLREREMRGAGFDMALFHDEQLRDGIDRANQLARLVDLRNANARGIAYENRKRVIAEFSEPGKPNDTGRPEVQGMSGNLSTRIRSLERSDRVSGEEVSPDRHLDRCFSPTSVQVSCILSSFY
ncbi:hypothetical protein EW146_g5855 [Bondarzewia mesenterica]|uniref:Uncharacterized protein n=1 Tax=Bondarzewia mesenterica TaxID=1095465 RepID=A0A4V3XEQ0_9AGAM|nr:hypothetical protein EW146_g5855 [Bondarzewia mesenterica]